MSRLFPLLPPSLIDCRNIAPSYNSNQSFKTHYMKKLLSTTIFSGLLLFSASAVKAQVSDSAQIKYLGTQDDLVVFNISYNNPQGAAFNLVVRDQDGSELYQHTFRDKNFFKQFRLPKDERSRLSFIIRNGKDTEIVKNFEINVNSRFVQDVAVKKLD